MKKILLLLMVFCYFAVHAQQGRYFINSFSPAQYGASDQNRAAVEDEFGQMYFANNDGILVYDGKTWKKIPMGTSAALTRTIAKDSKDIIYAAGEGDFGYLKRGERGNIYFVSLAEQNKIPLDSVGTIRFIRIISNSIYFCGDEKIYLWENGKLTTSKGNFHRFFVVDNNLLVRENGKGCVILRGNKLNFIEGSEIFSEERIDFIIPSSEKNKYWVGARNLGLFILTLNNNSPEKSSLKKGPNHLDEWMKKNELFCGSKINNSKYALGSQKGGLIILNSDFKIQQSIDHKTGLADDYVNEFYIDKSGNLWVCLNLGISFIELNTPITYWSQQDGISGTVEGAIVYKGVLYVATYSGVQYLDTISGTFIKTKVNFSSYKLCVANNQLIAATSIGLYRIENEKAELIYEFPDTYFFCKPFENLNIFIGGFNGGFFTGHFEEKIFIQDSVYENLGTVRSVAADKDGDLALGTSENGVIIFDAEKGAVRKLIGENEGLPEFSENSVFSFKGQIFIDSDLGVYKIVDKKNWKCIFSDILNDKNTRRSAVSKAIQIGEELWFQRNFLNRSNITETELSSFTVKNGALTENEKLLKRIQGVNAKDFFDYDSSVYISTNEGLYCYNRSTEPLVRGYHTFVSSFFEGANDSLPFLEHFSSGISQPEINFRFGHTEITAIVAASDFFDESNLKFSWWLEGHEAGYNDWITQYRINYSNLREGNYVLHVRSKNVLGVVGEEVVVKFKVLPPWYRTLWAYVLYGILAVLLIWIIVKLNLRRLQAQNIKLEETITERTKTIVDQKAEIEHKNQEITDSINYAKRIQLSILPEVKSIQENWKNTFVFYQPKDIVSGDFYWWRKLNEEEYMIAVADCTGHGVPGGFMCMICSDKLHESAKLYPSPDKVLFGANNAIKETLRQGTAEGGNKDGMEIALLKINKKTRNIQYSGANRFLWVVKNGTNEITEYKPDKASIASHTEYNFNYRVTEMQLEEGDQLYMSSDGFPDQFGGPDGKKFMSRNFKSFILSIKDKPIDVQGEEVKKRINDWMIGYEQVDDLLVIGIRL